MSWFMQAIKRYAEFEGRSRRKEFWFFVLFYIIFLIVASLIDGALVSVIGFPVLSVIVGLGLLIPSIAVSVRRLHDTGLSGWWYLLSLIPIVSLVLIYFFVKDSQPGSNDHGPNPKEA